MFKLPFLLVAGGLWSLTAATAQLAHRYDLNTVNDSVGTANGTLVNTGNTATLTGGILTTTGANGTDFLQLPASVGTGITGSFSVETWVQQKGGQSNGFATAFAFSSAQNTAGTTPAGGGNFLLFNGNRNGGGTAIAVAQPGYNNGAEGDNVFSTTPVLKDGPGATFPGTLHQIVLTYNAGTGALTLYNNGNQLGAVANFGTGFSFQSATSLGFNGINGGDVYTDQDFNGSTSDFRVYSSALSGTQVSTLFTDGSDASNATIMGVVGVPEPSTWMAMAVGFGALFGVQRFRRSVA